MTDAFLADVLHALGLGVIERLPNGTFHALTEPDWLVGVFESGAGGPHATLAGALPILGDFLVQAEHAWGQGAPTTAESGPFVADVGGAEVLLRATALTAGGRALLILERLTGIADARPVLQKAREQMLDRERMIQQIASLRPATASIGQAAGRLQESSLTDDQRREVLQIAGATAKMQTTLDALPLPPQRTSRLKT